MSLEGLTSAHTKTTKQVASTAPPRLPKQKPHTVIVGNLQFVHACFLVPNPQGGSVERCAICSKEIDLYIIGATQELLS